MLQNSKTTSARGQHPPPPGRHFLSLCLYKQFNAAFSFLGDCLGRLRAHGSQELHGNGPDCSRRAGLDQHGDGLVQAVPHLLSGRLQHRTAYPTSFPVFSREFNEPVLFLKTSQTRKRRLKIYREKRKNALSYHGFWSHDLYIFHVFPSCHQSSSFRKKKKPCLLTIFNVSLPQSKGMQCRRRKNVIFLGGGI